MANKVDKAFYNIVDNELKWIILGAIIATFLFEGDPDITDSLINLIQVYSENLKCK